VFTNNLHIANRLTAVVPKLVVTAINKNINTDAIAILKNSDKMGNLENSKADTVELSNIHKETKVSTEKSWVEDLVGYVDRRAKEIRESIPKPIPPEMAWAIINADYPHKEEIEREQVLAAKLKPIDAKLKCGKQLTPEEIDFLREFFPEIYLMAIRIEREIEQFRKQLSHCDTKEEKLQLVAQKKKQLLGASKVDPGYTQCMLAAIDEEVKKM